MASNDALSTEEEATDSFVAAAIQCCESCLCLETDNIAKFANIGCANIGIKSLIYSQSWSKHLL